tara:strand:- start:421 stop:1374 length:954 start_codon:yes stop_codon:yes gene_type:complete
MRVLNKKGAMDTFQVLILLGFGLALWQLGAFDAVLGQAATGDGAAAGTTVISGLPACIGIDKTTVTLAATDKFDSSVSISGNHQYKVNGGRATTVADGGTFDASPGDTLQVLWAQGNNSGENVYLNKFVEYEIPCAGTKTFSEGLYRNGTITSRIFNEEGNLIDDIVENETLAAGDVVSLNYELQGQFERGQFANGGCVTVDYNTSAYDDVIVAYDAGSEKIGNPDYATASATQNVLKTYSIPAFTSNTKLTGTITMDSDNTVNPSAAEDISLAYYPNEVRLNPDTNTFDLFACGENQDGNRVANSIDTQGDTVQID